MLPILAAAALLTSPANAQQVNPGPNPGAPLWPLLPLATVTAPVDAVAPWHYHSARRADVVSRYYAAQRPWHGPYAYTQWGTPVALVVPPNSKMHTSWSWGVSQSEMIPIYHQFHRDYPGGLALGGGAQINPTPYWPSHTDQFGVYPVRGPW
jgi:hypothetical protein